MLADGLLRLESRGELELDLEEDNVILNEVGSYGGKEHGTHLTAE